MADGEAGNPYGARDSHLRGSEGADDDCFSSCYKTGMWCGGVITSILCLPCACCGGGPVRTVNEGERAAILEFGKLKQIVGPGTYHFNPGTQTFRVKSIRIQTMDVPRQQMLTRDNVPVTVNAVVYYRVFDVERSLFTVGDDGKAISNLAQSTLRTVVGENKLDEMFLEREAINDRLKMLVDRESDEWGIQVTNVEVKDMSIPDSMQRVLASVAEAEREGQAKVITAMAELNAAQTLAEASDIMATNPLAIQLRYFQTLSEISAEKNSTVIVPESTLGMFAHILKGGSPDGEDWDYENALEIREKIMEHRAAMAQKEALGETTESES